MNAPAPSDESPAFRAELEAERDRCIRLTRMGIGMPVAGFVYWLVFAWLVSRFRIDSAVYMAFFATGAVFPLGAGLTRLFGGDLFAKSRSLTPLGLQLAAIQLFYWPVIILLAKVAPAWTPYVMAVLFGSHFLPYGWLYRSKGYMLLAILTAVATTVTVLVARGPVPHLVPLIAAGCYLVSILVIRSEVAGVMRGVPATTAPVPAGG
jgi:hypothetical protein